MQDQEQAAGHPGPSVVQSPAAEQEHSKLSPGREGEEAPSRVVSTHPEERTLSMQTPEPAAAELLLLGQDSGQGAGQLAGQAASLSVQAVHALGTELCAKVRLLLVPGTAMASEMLLLQHICIRRTVTPQSSPHALDTPLLYGWRIQLGLE